MKKIWGRIEWLIYGLFVRFYRLRDDEIAQCDIIVPHCYGLLKDDTLPEATRLTLTEAVMLSRCFPKAQILMTSASYFGGNRQYIEDGLKVVFLKRFGVTAFVLAGIRNTVYEVRAVHAEIKQRADPLPHRNITAICDAPQMRSVRRIWREVFADSPNVTISIKAVQARWEEPHRAKFQQSPLRWFAANILRDLALKFRGLEYVAGISHPIT